MSVMLLASVLPIASSSGTVAAVGIKPDWFTVQWQVQRTESEATLWMCDWSENGTLIGCVYFDSHVNIYNATDGRLVKSLNVPQQTTRCDGYLPKNVKYPTRYLDFSPDGKMLAVASDDLSAYLFWTSNWTLCKQLRGHKGAVLCCQFSPDSKYLLTGSGFEKVNGTGIGENVTKVWDISTGKCLTTLTDQLNGSVISMIYSPTGREFAVNSDDSTICIYDASTFKLKKKLEGHGSGVLDCEWSPDEKRMVSGSRDYTARVWDLVNNTSVQYTHANCVRCTRWDKQGRYFITSGIDKDTAIQIFDPSKSVPQVVFPQGKEHDSNAMATRFSPDGSRFVSALGKSRYLVMFDQEKPVVHLVIFTKERVGLGIFALVSLIALVLIVIRPVRNKMHRRRG